MEINKKIKIVYKDSLSGEINEREIKIRNILDLKKHIGVSELYFWNTYVGSMAKINIFEDNLIKWFDKEGVESTDYEKLVDMLSVYAEQTKLKDAIAYLS